jgi:hypothetical protein
LSPRKSGKLACVDGGFLQPLPQSAKPQLLCRDKELLDASGVGDWALPSEDTAGAVVLA